MEILSKQSSEKPWTAERLRGWLAGEFQGRPMIVLANREPIHHERDADGAPRPERSTGGLVTALEPFVEACAGVWVAHGSGSADRLVVDDRDGVAVPADRPRYRLRRVWLDAEEEREYYDGFANEALWPLCHAVHVAPIFRTGDFNTYRAVNAKFSRAVCDEARGRAPVVFVQDYHFALAPQLIRRYRADAAIATFWHIPWPDSREYATCPWRRELLEGLLGSTLLGFQTLDDRDNFLAAVERFVDCDVDHHWGVVCHKGGETTARAYPVSVEWPSRWTRQLPPVGECRAAVRAEIGVATDALVGVGVDRLDYTKGLEQKFVAVERLLERRPDLRGRFVFIQVAEPSRNRLPAYREVSARVLRLAHRINSRFGSDEYKPIVLLQTRHEPWQVFRLLRAADFCYVASLRDGMNLVAKEFVSARDDERGVLMLSEFAGAAHELVAALLVNPYAIDDAANAMDRAVGMSLPEQAMRMRALRSVVARANAYRWVREMLADLRALDRPSRPAQLAQSLLPA